MNYLEKNLLEGFTRNSTVYKIIFRKKNFRKFQRKKNRKKIKTSFTKQPFVKQTLESFYRKKIVKNQKQNYEIIFHKTNFEKFLWKTRKKRNSSKSIRNHQQRTEETRQGR